MKLDNSNLIVEVDITHRCNMRCRHCNRLCNAEDNYGVVRVNSDMDKIHIDFLCHEVMKQPKGRIRMIRIIGGEPLLSPIIDYAIASFEDLLREGYISGINIVTNGTVEPTLMSQPYLVYAPICVGDLIKERGGRVLSTKEVYAIKNEKHRNITLSPKDINADYKVCNRIIVCGIQYTIYGFSYTAACFPAMFVSQINHKRFLYHIPDKIEDFFDNKFESEVCSLCVSAIDNYKELVFNKPEIQSPSFIGDVWQTMVQDNRIHFQEPDTSWINRISN